MLSHPIRRLLRSTTLLSLLAIVAIGLLAHAPWIAHLGFYKEDWYVIWTGFTQGARALIPLFDIDRPLIGYQFALLYPLLGYSPLAWQLYALGLRLLSGVVLLWVLQMVWPRNRLETTLMAMFFVVYPGFLQLPQATTFQTALASMTLALISIGLTVRSLRVHTWWVWLLLNGLAALLAVVYLLLMEYAIGLEVFRFVLVGYVLWREKGGSVRKWLAQFTLRWAAYGIITVGFLFWRLVIFKSTRPATDVERLFDSYLVNRIGMIARFGIEILRGVLETVLFAWSVPLYQEFYRPDLAQAAAGILIALFAVMVLVLYLRSMRSEAAVTNLLLDQQTSRNWILIGFLLVVAALAPVIAANRNVQFVDRLDRYTLPASIGVAILVVGFLSYLSRPRIRTYALSLLLFLAVLTHFLNGLHMAQFWEVQRQVWWQMSWRAPDLKDRTLLFINLPKGFEFGEGYEAWAPANLIYSPVSGPPLISGEVLYAESADLIMQGVKKPKSHRGIWINRLFANTLLVSMPTQGSCADFIDGQRYELPTNEDPMVRLVAPYSRIDLIDVSAPLRRPTEEIFGHEPEHTWCYYYQKAALARQKGDWQELVRLGDEARAKGYAPQNSSEWVPFLEGYAVLGREQDARKIAEQMAPNFSLCQQFTSDNDYPDPDSAGLIQNLLCQ